MKRFIKLLLRESLINEISLNTPYVKVGDFNFTEFDSNYYYSFVDEHNDNIDIMFYTYGDNRYEINFSVNDEMFQAGTENRSVGHYLRIMSTVISAVIQFIQEMKPEQLRFITNPKKKKFYDRLIPIDKIKGLGYVYDPQTSKLNKLS